MRQDKTMENLEKQRELTPAPTFASSASTLSPNNLNRTSNIYATAQYRLQEKVPSVISQKEYDEFMVLGASLGSYAKASELLQSLVQSEDLYYSKHHQFFRKVNSLLEPLRFLQTALDTLCQAQGTLCLLWGSVKVLVKVAEEVSRISTMILDGIQDLKDSLPIYEWYHRHIPASSDQDCPIRGALEVIYVEYMTFCILARKHAKSHFASSLRPINADNRPIANCLRAIELEKRRVHQITSMRNFVILYDLNAKSDARSANLHARLDALQDLLVSHKMASSTASSSGSTLTASHHMVPSLLSTEFVGREQELGGLESIFCPEDNKRVGGRAGIHGMTGIGKTQLMLKYEATNRHCYRSQLFVLAPTKAKLHSSLDEVLDRLNLAPRHKGGLDITIRAVQEWLSQSESWLFLIDNVSLETVDLVRQLLPAHALGHVIVTSQFRRAAEMITGSSKTCISLEELEYEDAIDLFLAAADIEPDDEAGRRAGKVIVTQMGCVPHAIEQAASYLKVNGLNPNVFIARYDKTPEKILAWEDWQTDESTRRGTGGQDGEDSRFDSTRRFPINRHFRMIFDSLHQHHPDALATLKFYSFLEQESIPLFNEWYRDELTPGFPSTLTVSSGSTGARGLKKDSKLREIRGIASLVFSRCLASSRRLDIMSDQVKSTENSESSKHASEVLEDIFRDESRSERAISMLSDLHLVRRIKGERYLWMHDLTKKTVRATIPKDDVENWVDAAINIMYHMIPASDDTSEKWAFTGICLPGARGLLHQASTLGFELARYACFLALCARCSFLHGSWDLARQQFEEVYAVYAANLGPHHPRTLTLQHSLAWAHRDDVGTRVAEEQFRQVWQSRSKTMGESAPETLEALNDLASTIERAGRLKEAEDLFQALYDGYKKLALERAVQSNTGIFAPVQSNTEISAAAHNLGNCLFNQGRLTDAERMYRVALENKTLKPDRGLRDRGILSTMLNYAATLDQNAMFKDAQGIYEDALIDGFVKTMGLEHVLTLRFRANFAALHRQLGHLDQAEEMLEDVLETETRIYGADNFETIATLHSLGEVWHAKGELGRAKEAFERAVDLRSSESDSPILPRYLDSLAVVQMEMGQISQALTTSKRAYDKFKAIIGWHNPFTLMAANDYAEVLMANSQHQAAWDLLTKCRDSFGKLPGKEHPHYAMVLNNMGRLSLVFETHPGKNLNRSLGLFQEAQSILADRLGPDHPCSLIVSLNMVRCQFLMNPSTEDFDALVARIGQIRASLQNLLGSSHPLTLACNTALGIMFACRACQDSVAAANDDATAAALLQESCDYLNTAVKQIATKAERRDSANHFLDVSLLFFVLLRQHHWNAGTPAAGGPNLTVSGRKIDASDTNIASVGALLLTDGIRHRAKKTRVALPVADAAAALAEHILAVNGGSIDNNSTRETDAWATETADMADFNFSSYITGYVPLLTGETFRLTWGRKNCWRSVTGEAKML